MRWRRRIGIGVAVLLAAVALLLARPLWHLGRTTWRDVDERLALPDGQIDDASRMNATAVAEVWQVPVAAADPEAQIAALLARAQAEGRRVSIAGARHSMGGHTFYPGGIVLDMREFREMSLAGDILTVQSGAWWAEVIPYLDAQGKSVAIMQSNDSFSVGGSISVNCHGWQAGRPPIASSVEAFRIMLADGSVRRCSREAEPELFAHALGGYGLFGVILDVELRVVPNQAYERRRQVVALAEADAVLQRDVYGDPSVQMAYARLCVLPDRLFDEMVLTTCRIAPDTPIPALGEPAVSQLRRSIFRGSEGSDYGKLLRWRAEAGYEARANAVSLVSRNQLLHVSTDEIVNRREATTDILHEYFLPRDQMHAFLTAARPIIRRYEADLLNVTMRFVEPDTDTALRYADQPVCSFVMLFSQARTAVADAAMQALTRELIDAALELGGRYYLPYRLHATPEQFHRAYPMAAAFFDCKRRYDPALLFQNHVWTRYAGAPAPAVDLP